jgi:hypothetical protein
LRGHDRNALLVIAGQIATTPASARFPKFVRLCGYLLYELRKAKGTSKYLILVPLSI